MLFSFVQRQKATHISSNENSPNDQLYASAVTKIKMAEQTPFSHKNMFGQSLKVTNRMSKLGFTGVIFIDLAVKIDGT